MPQENSRALQTSASHPAAAREMELFNILNHFVLTFAKGEFLNVNTGSFRLLVSIISCISGSFLPPGTGWCPSSGGLELCCCEDGPPQQGWALSKCV